MSEQYKEFLEGTDDLWPKEHMMSARHKFNTLFGSEFDYEALSKGSIQPPPVDTIENFKLLSKLKTTLDIWFMHIGLGEELSGRMTVERNVGGIDLREKGNSLYKQGKIEEALKLYTEAVALNQAEVRNFTNRAICLINLGRNEEAMTDLNIASDIDPNFTKLHLLMVKACCNLGYVDKALMYGQALFETVSNSDYSNFVAEFRQLMKSVPAKKKKAMDDNEIKATQKRLLSHDPTVPPEVFTFLLEHFFELTVKTVEEMAEKNFPVMLQCMTETPYISSFVKDPRTRIMDISPGESRLLGCFITQLHNQCDDDLGTCEKLVSNPLFVEFFPKLAIAMANRSSFEANFRKVGPGYIYSCFFGSVMHLIAILAKYHSIRNTFLKNTPPFNDLSFYAHLIAFQPCAFDTRDSPNTNMFVDTFTSVICEPWFFEKLEPCENFDHAISLLATMGSILLQCRSADKRDDKPPFASFLPLWLKLSKSPVFCPVLARRPGVWYHFATRLAYATKDLETFSAYSHHRRHLEDTLTVLDNLCEQPIPVGDVTAKEIALPLQSSLCSLLKYLAETSLTGHLAKFFDSITPNIVRIMVRLLQIPHFAEGFLTSSEDLVLPYFATLITNKTDLKELYQSLKLLLHSADSEHVAALMDDPVFPGFVKKLVETIEGSSEYQHISIEILYILVEKEKVSGTVMKGFEDFVLTNLVNKLTVYAEKEQTEVTNAAAATSPVSLLLAKLSGLTVSGGVFSA